MAGRSAAAVPAAWRRPVCLCCTVDGALAPHQMAAVLMAAPGHGAAPEVSECVCGQADRALTPPEHFYLFISSLGLKRFCEDNLHKRWVLLGAAAASGGHLDTDMMRSQQRQWFC